CRHTTPCRIRFLARTRAAWPAFCCSITWSAWRTSCNRHHSHMLWKISALTIIVALLAGCGSTSSSSWLPWVATERDTRGPYTPPGAKGYACEGGKRLLVRFESDAKSAWVIYSDHQLRLDRVTATGGDEYSRAGTTLSTRDGETTLIEGTTIQYAKCKPEAQ